jgi:hypothetical protein
MISMNNTPANERNMVRKKSSKGLSEHSEHFKLSTAYVKDGETAMP